MCTDKEALFDRYYEDTFYLICITSAFKIPGAANITNSNRISALVWLIDVLIRRRT